MLAKYLEKKERSIKKNVLKMGNESCIAIKKAIQCLKSIDVKMAEEVIANDVIINNLETEVESACVHMIATQQPIAHDLRELLADMNIAKELERIADYAVSIAKIVQKLPQQENKLEPEIFIMAEKVINMLTDVMVDYAEEDAKKAIDIAAVDDEIDALELELNEKFFNIMQESPDATVSCTYQLWVVHQLERVGDRVTNIAESVVFQATGDVVNFN